MKTKQDTEEKEAKKVLLTYKIKENNIEKMNEYLKRLENGK